MCIRDRISIVINEKSFNEVVPIPSLWSSRNTAPQSPWIDLNRVFLLSNTLGVSQLQDLIYRRISESNWWMVLGGYRSPSTRQTSAMKVKSHLSNALGHCASSRSSGHFSLDFSFLAYRHSLKHFRAHLVSVQWKVAFTNCFHFFLLSVHKTILFG